MKHNNTFYCFTPLVTLGTFFVEVGLGLFALARYRHTLFGRLTALLLFFLSIFQLSEYMLCSNGMSLPWATIGWVSITFLPAVGLHLASLLTTKTSWVKIGYFVAGVFTLIFIGSAQLFTTVSCPGNYVQFVSALYALNNVYPFYYGLFIALATAKLIRAYIQGGTARTVIGWFLIADVCYIVPTAFVYIFLPLPLSSFPSVFCGFAVFLALVLTRKVLPFYHTLIEQEQLDQNPLLQEI